MKNRFARTLRSNATDAERRLWQVLRNRRLDGIKFRRQAAIGPFVVDFLCVTSRLVIEIDGGQHVADQLADKARTEYLESKGFRVVRFWNHDLLQNLEGVLSEIRRALAQP